MPMWSRRCMGGGGLGQAGLGVSGQLFGIHRYRSESELGFATEHRRRRGRKTKIAIGVVIASMASLFVCLLVIDMTQSSEPFHSSGAQRQRHSPPPSDQSNPINISSSIRVSQMEAGNLANELEIQSQAFPPTSVGEDFLTLAKHSIPDPRENLLSTDDMERNTLTHQEDVDLFSDVGTTTDLPTSTSLTDFQKRVEQDQSTVETITTTRPETDKKSAYKSARSLPEDRVRGWSGTFKPDSTDGSVTGQGARQEALEALPYIGHEVGLPQWNDMQKRSGIPLPAFDTNKWLEALRAQYQVDKNPNPWQNRAGDPSRNPRPFHPGADASQNQQLLVVNNRGVVIPNSVQFPEVVKSAAYPQLQTYRYPQTSRNIQDILRYMTASSTNNNPIAATNRLRQNQWPPAVKKAAKVAGMYVSPTDGYANTYVATRPEAAFLAATAATAPVGVKPLNGHAYISDPFHPYKPADPTEINHLAAASSDYNSGYSDSDLSNSFVYPTKSTKQAHLRNHFSGTKPPQLQPQATSYTTAVFKPLGNQDQMATSTGSVDSLMQHLPQQQKRVLPPLSVMLEIYPMTNDDSRAVPFRGTATSHAFRRPSQVNSNPSVSLFQKDAAGRRPVSLAVDASLASPAMNVPVVATPMQYQPQGQPAFGMTLAGLPPLPGMAASDSKHRMVVHLNFYPKKAAPTQSIVPRLRDPTEDFQAGVPGSAGTATGGVFTGDYPQRRQSGPKQTSNDDTSNYTNGRKGNHVLSNSVVQAEFDASSLANVLPGDVVQHFSDIFRTYQNPSPQDSDHHNTYEIASDDDGYEHDREGHRGSHSYPEEHEDFDDDSDDDEEDDDDEEEGRVVPYPEEMRRNPFRRRPPMMRGPENARLPFYRSWRPAAGMSWSDVQDDDEDEGVVEEVEAREADERPARSRIMHVKSKLPVSRESPTTSSSTTTSTTTTEMPEVERENQPYKPRRRLIIESSPKNHRMQ